MKEKRLKVSIIGTNGIPARYGGFETLAEYLALHLSDEFEMSVYCSGVSQDKRINHFNGAKLVYIPFRANGWQSMIYDALSIIHALFRSDKLVILGFSGVFAFPLKPLFRKKIIFNIGGIEWQKVRGRRSFARLEVFMKKLFEKVCVRFSDVILADNAVLKDYVTNTYAKDAILAEYGGDHAVKLPVSKDAIAKYPFLTADYDVTVSRAQEDMNIHLILDAYSRIPDRKLVVISNWHITEYGKSLKNKYLDSHPNIILLDAIYNIDELNTIRSNATIYIHSHALCGTAPSLTEAMSIGLPVICFDVETNRATTEGRSLYFQDPEQLISLVTSLNKNSVRDLASGMKEIAQRRYTWKRITNIYRNAILKN